jgi:uncharacterized membrane protein
MTRGRLEAFSDGVIAIIITIMVLEMRPPRSSDLASLLPLVPVLLSYVLSFVFVGIYWNNHHHLLHTVHEVNGTILWANLHLLFWLSLVPFVTAWVGANSQGTWPAVLYGVVLLMAAVAFTILVRTIVALHGKDSELAKAVGKDVKGKLSLLFYSSGIGFAFVWPWIAYGLYVLVAMMWLIPDRRIEQRIRK